MVVNPARMCSCILSLRCKCTHDSRFCHASVISVGHEAMHVRCNTTHSGLMLNADRFAICNYSHEHMLCYCWGILLYAKGNTVSRMTISLLEVLLSAVGVATWTLGIVPHAKKNTHRIFSLGACNNSQANISYAELLSAFACSNNDHTHPCIFHRLNPMPIFEGVMHKSLREHNPSRTHNHPFAYQITPWHIFAAFCVLTNVSCNGCRCT